MLPTTLYRNLKNPLIGSFFRFFVFKSGRFILWTAVKRSRDFSAKNTPHQSEGDTNLGCDLPFKNVQNFKARFLEIPP